MSIYTHYLIAIIISIGLTACGGAPKTLKIGLGAPFEGLDRAIGYEALFATKLALQERNTNGGVGGYQVELVALNDFNEPDEARVQAKALLADPDIFGVVGHLSARTTWEAFPIYQAAGLAVSIPADSEGNSKETTAFSETYQKLSGLPPSPRAVLVYEATNILLDSIDQAILIDGKPTRLGVSAVMRVRLPKSGLKNHTLKEPQ